MRESRGWCALAAAAGVIFLSLFGFACGGSDTGETNGPEAKAAPKPPPANAGFDYQISGDYPPPKGVTVVSRDSFIGKPAPDPGYSICYINAFQTQDDSGGTNRPDAKSSWPKDLVLDRLGDDPNWGGEYLVDISTAGKRKQAAEWVQQMIDGCARKGFDAVEYDNLDSWTRFDGTPLEGKVPFGKKQALEFAKLITERAHAAGMAVGQKNTTDITRKETKKVGFSFAVAEECGRWNECEEYRKVYGNQVIDIEYRRQDFTKACTAVGKKISVVLRDLQVSRPGEPQYIYKAC